MVRKSLFGVIVLLAAALTVPVLGTETASASPSTASPNSAAIPAGRISMLVGQTTPDLDAYHQQVLGSDASFPRPAGVTLYTNISPNACNGLHATCNLNGNVDNFDQTLAEYPGAAVAVGLYLSDSPGCNNQPLRAIIGRQDADIAGALGQQYRQNLDDLITYLKNTGRQIYLRIGYEFDGPWNCYNADFYKQAFRVVKQRIDTLGAGNVATVWQSATYPKDGDAQYGYDFSNTSHLDSWYPGDDVVDYVAMSSFYWDATYRQYQWACDTPTTNPQTLYDRVLNFARAHGKPAMIAESTPQAYRTAELDASCTNVDNRVSLNGDWTKVGSWYDQYFGYINANADVLRVVSYINSDWEAISQFNCPVGATAGSANCTDGYWGDSRVQDNPNILANFKRELQNNIFVNGTLSGRGANWGSGTPTSPPTTSPTTPPTTPPTTAPTTPPAGNRDAFSTIEGESWNSQSGVQNVSSAAASGGSEAGHLASGDWARYDGVNFSGRTPNQVTFRYSSPRPTSQAFTLEFHAGSATGPVIAAPGLLGTGSLTSYQQISFNVSNLPAGTTSITVVARANDTADVLDLDWFRFV